METVRPEDNNIFRIRPAGRHIFTIGKELVQDPITALIELVKNSYDADASFVSIIFTQKVPTQLEILIEDDGHGMSYEDVTNRWIVPSTSNKIDRKASPLGRTFQGRKGIGRFAVTILGDELLLETININNFKTSLYIDWNEFNKKEYLDEVPLIIEREKINNKNGTKLIITSSNYSNYWDQNNFNKLIKELKKLRTYSSNTNVNNKITDIESFEIKIKTIGVLGLEDIENVIKPFPILELYDYRIYGNFVEDKDKDKDKDKDEQVVGILSLYYECSKNKEKNVIEITKEISIRGQSCGNLEFDIRVYDRDPSSIDALISKGLKNDDGKFVGKNEAKNILNENNGIGVFRHGFRIRPLGDPDYDWLELNKRRVQNPSLKIGSDQVIGAVSIEVEEKSHLTEKTARDGLTNNAAYQTLIEMTNIVISELENRRWNYRQDLGFESKTIKIQRELDELFSTQNLEKNIEKTLGKTVDPEVIQDVLKFVQDDSKKKHKIFERVERTLAIYEGQVTVGKIVQHVIHEGRQPLAYFRNEAPRIKTRVENISKSDVQEEKNKFYDQLNKISDGIISNTQRLSDLFKRIDPLATGHRGKPKTYNLYKLLEDSKSFFREDFNKYQIGFNIIDAMDIDLIGYEQDIISLFINLIDNSIYWMIHANSVNKKIIINCFRNSDGLIEHIDYRDTGPGLDPITIQNDLIFEPHYSTKPNGIGIGLAIAGEMAERLGFVLKALDSKSGAYFRLERK